MVNLAPVPATRRDYVPAFPAFTTHETQQVYVHNPRHLVTLGILAGEWCVCVPVANQFHLSFHADEDTARRRAAQLGFVSNTVLQSNTSDVTKQHAVFGVGRGRL